MIIDEKWIKEHCDEDTFKKAKKFSKRNDGVRIFEINTGYTEYPSFEVITIFFRTPLFPEN